MTGPAFSRDFVCLNQDILCWHVYTHVHMHVHHLSCRNLMCNGH